MKKLLAVFIAAIIFAGTAWAANPVLINVDDASPPFAYSVGGNVVGIYPIIFYKAFARMGVPVKISAKPWNQALAEADNGKVAIGDIYATPERLAKYDFSEPIFTENIAVYFNKNKPINFKSIADLYGKKVGIVHGRYYGDSFEAAKKNAGITTIESFNDKANFQNLTSGGLDAILSTEESGRAIIFSSKLLSVEQSKEYLISNKGHLSFVKSANQTELLAKFNKTIAAMKLDGSFDKLVRSELDR